MYSLDRPDICLRQSRLVIGQFGCSGLPPSDAKPCKGEAQPLKVNVKIFQLGTIFKFQVKSCKTFRLRSLHCCALNLKVRAKIVTSLLKNLTLNICSVQIQWGFSDALPFYSAGSWVSELSGSAASDLRPREWRYNHCNRHML